MVESTQSNKTPAKILVVEDESEIRELISLLLLRQGHSVQQCRTAVEAAASLQKDKYDLMVLDWMMPQMSGIDLLKSFSTNLSRPPVLMVTAKSEPQDIVQGLEAGADDYITKPFEPAVFSARISALLRRVQTKQSSNSIEKKDVLSVGQLKMNLATYEVKCGDSPIHLTPSEFKILSSMAINQGRVLTRDQLIEVAQGEGVTVTGRTIDTHVFGLRKKLGPCVDIIETIRGVGYRVKTEI